MAHVLEISVHGHSGCSKAETSRWKDIVESRGLHWQQEAERQGESQREGARDQM